MYVRPNIKTKSDLRARLVGGETITVFDPGPFARPTESYNGVVTVEGPHSPEPHKWWGQVNVVNGVVTGVKK